MVSSSSLNHEVAYPEKLTCNRYSSFVPELQEARLRARKLVKKYNDHLPDDATTATLNADRALMLEKILGRMGEGSRIEPPFYVDYGCNTAIGDGFYANTKYVFCVIPLYGCLVYC